MIKRKQLAVGAALTALTAVAVAASFLRSSSPAEAAGNSSVQAARPTAADASAELKWNTDVEATIERARAAGKPVFIDFYADWCPPCRMMESTTFKDENVKFLLQNYELVKVDVDEAAEVAAKFGVQSLPTLLCLKPEGQKKFALGYQSAEKLGRMLSGCTAGATVQTGQAVQ